MSWRSLALAFAALPLAACGFHPLYAERTPLGYDPTLATVEVRPAADRIGQIMTDELREQLNPRGIAADKRYVLTVVMTQTRSDLGLRRDNTASRGEIALDASLVLTARGSESVLLRDNLHRVTGFELSEDAYAATVAEDKVSREAAVDLGREIATRVQLFLERQRQAQGGS